MWGDDIREARIAEGLSQSELARRAGVSRKQLTLIEKNRNASIETLGKIAAHLPALRAINFGSGPVQTTPGATTRFVDLDAIRRHASDAMRAAEAIQQLTTVRSSESVDETKATIAVPPGSASNVHFFERARSSQIRDSSLTDLLRAPDTPFRLPQRLVTDDWVDVTIEGRVAAGLAGIDYEATDTVRVAPEQAPEKGWKALEAWGDSMIEFGIESGDVVYVEPRRGGVAATGELVIGWLNEGLVIKEWRRRGSKRFLISGNREIDPREIGPDDTWELQAIVRRVVTRSPRTIDFPNISGRKKA